DDGEVGSLGSYGNRREGAVPSLTARKREGLSQAVQLPSDQRRAFIRSQFPSDDASTHELEMLLAGFDRASRANPGWTVETTFGDVGPRSNVVPFPSETTALLTHDRKFGPYRVVKVLKPGGMGEVAIADDARLPRQVVLKC